jgi:adenylosuccinate lyase
MENIALWHERDISHSSAERVIAPDATIVLHFSLGRFRGMMEKLVVYPDRMRKNLESTHGLLYSQRVLLALTGKGISREKAYEMVQRSAMKCWRTGQPLSTLLWKDRDVRAVLTKKEFDGLFEIGYYLKNIDGVIDRVFGRKGGKA